MEPIKLHKKLLHNYSVNSQNKIKEHNLKGSSRVKIKSTNTTLNDRNYSNIMRYEFQIHQETEKKQVIRNSLTHLHSYKALGYTRTRGYMNEHINTR